MPQAATPEHALQVPENAQQPVEELLVCPNCGRVYWHGLHYKRTMNKLESWKAGKLENWKTGKLENWKTGNKIQQQLSIRLNFIRTKVS